MRRPIRNHKADFKAKVVLAVLLGDKTLAELAEKFEVHANQISQWRQQTIDNMAASFGKEPVGAVYEDEIKDLHANIGLWTLEVDFFECAGGLAGLPSAKRHFTAPMP